MKHFKPLRSRCDTAYRVVEDTLYNEECTVDVKHICEEHINVPTYHMEHGYSQPKDPLKMHTAIQATHI